jgi:hypothetical protein
MSTATCTAIAINCSGYLERLIAMEGGEVNVDPQARASTDPANRFGQEGRLAQRGGALSHGRAPRPAHIPGIERLESLSCIFLSISREKFALGFSLRFAAINA